MRPEDVLVLLKIAVVENCEWNAELLSFELGHSVTEIEASLRRLKTSKLLRSSNQPDPEALKRFLLKDLPELFPAAPGKQGRGILTGAKPDNYHVTADLPYTSIWIWSTVDGQDMGFEIPPLSPHCCFAALNDQRLRKVLAITETLRVSGHKAQVWAELAFRQIGLF